MKGFAVRFSDISRWSPASFTNESWHWPADVIRPLSHALTPHIEALDRAESESTSLATLRFDGSMERRKESSTSLKGKLFRAGPGNVVYSKIDVRNGAIGVIPKHLGDLAFTSEFPIYCVDSQQILADYITLVFRSAAFLRTINGMVSGASGRKRVMPADLLRVDIPQPPIATQRAIVAHWDIAQNHAANMAREAEIIERKGHTAFLAGLGLSAPNQHLRQRAFAVRWSDTERWGLEWHQQRLDGLDLNSGKYSAVPLGELLDRVQYGTSDKANTENHGVTVLRMNNIFDGRIDTTTLKHVLLSKYDIDRWRLNNGDILIIRTNGSRDLVGTCAVFDLDGEYVFASYLIRLIANRSKALPDFVSALLNSTIGRSQIDATSRQIMQNNINSEELKSLRIPLPPLPVQAALAAGLASARQQANAMRTQARERRETARAEVEAMIRGHMPAPTTAPSATPLPQEERGKQKL